MKLLLDLQLTNANCRQSFVLKNLSFYIRTYLQAREQ